MRLDSDAIIDAYINGESLETIAQKYHSYPTSIKRVLTRNNIPVRNNGRKKGELYVHDGEKLLEWAASQGRPVTKKELAEIAGTARLSPSYFIKYPELGQYLQSREQVEFQVYYNKLYQWLQDNHILYKVNDRTRLGVSLDILLLGEYSNIALQICEKPKCVSNKRHTELMNLKHSKAKEAGLSILFLTKDDLDNLDAIKSKLNELKNN